MVGGTVIVVLFLGPQTAQSNRQDFNKHNVKKEDI
jgi:hypothetical protein